MNSFKKNMKELRELNRSSSIMKQTEPDPNENFAIPDNPAANCQVLVDSMPTEYLTTAGPMKLSSGVTEAPLAPEFIVQAHHDAMGSQVQTLSA